MKNNFKKESFKALFFAVFLNSTLSGEQYFFKNNILQNTCLIKNIF